MKIKFLMLSSVCLALGGCGKKEPRLDKGPMPSEEHGSSLRDGSQQATYKIREYDHSAITSRSLIFDLRNEGRRESVDVIIRIVGVVSLETRLNDDPHEPKLFYIDLPYDDYEILIRSRGTEAESSISLSFTEKQYIQVLYLDDPDGTSKPQFWIRKSTQPHPIAKIEIEPAAGGNG